MSDLATTILDREYKEADFGPVVEASECAVVGSFAWLSKTDSELLGTYISPADFYFRQVGQMFATLLQRASKDLPNDDPILFEEAMLETPHKPPQGGWGTAYLKCMDYVINPGNAVYHAKQVRDASIRREAIRECNLAIKLAGSTVRSHDELAEKLAAQAETIRARRQEAALSKARDLAPDVYDRVLRDTEMGKVRRVVWGIPALDRVTGGIHPGMIIVGARPSVGKSALLTGVAKDNLRKGIPVAIVSYEMTRHEVAQRLFSQATKTNMGIIAKNQMGEKTLEKLKAWLEGEFRNWPLHVYGNEAKDPRRLATILRGLKSTEPTLGLVIIDYVQLMTWEESKPLPMREMMTKISNYLKQLANETGLPIVVLSQFSRPMIGARKTAPRPTLASFKETGALEQDADVALMLYRTVKASAENNFVGKVDVIVGKQRNGPLATISTVFMADYVSFFEEQKQATPF